MSSMGFLRKIGNLWSPNKEAKLKKVELTDSQLYKISAIRVAYFCLLSDVMQKQLLNTRKTRHFNVPKPFPSYCHATWPFSIRRFLLCAANQANVVTG